MILKIFFVLIITLFYKQYENFNDAPCRTDLTDIEYLEHMIPHHQVAIDISILLEKQSKWPKMKELLRKLIWVQKYEIALMEEVLQKFPNNLTNREKMRRTYISVISDYMKPNKLGMTKTYCDPHFFDPKAHMKHMEHMKLDDNMYIHHMIPHHQVAVDMSKKLLKNTRNDFMIYLAYRIIQSQQEEITLLKDMLKSDYRHSSNLI